MTQYPNRWECDVVLTDSETVHLRPIRSEDTAGERAFLEKLTPETVFLRFQAPKRVFTDEDIPPSPEWTATCAWPSSKNSGEMIPMGRYGRLPEAADEAEVVFVVVDAHQGRGIGTLLLEHLAAIACHDVPRTSEMDINPLIVSPSAATAVDMGVLAGRYAGNPGLGTRRLG